MTEFEDCDSRILRNFDRGEFHAFVITLINLSAGAIGIKILRFWGVLGFGHPAIAWQGQGAHVAHSGRSTGPRGNGCPVGCIWGVRGGWLQGFGLWALAHCLLWWAKGGHIRGGTCE